MNRRAFGLSLFAVPVAAVAALLKPQYADGTPGRLWRALTGKLWYEKRPTRDDILAGRNYQGIIRPALADKDLGISMRFIQQYDIEADKSPRVFDYEASRLDGRRPIGDPSCSCRLCVTHRQYVAAYERISQLPDFWDSEA